MNWPKQPHKDYVIERCRMPFELLYVRLQASKQANNSNDVGKNATTSKEKTKVKKLAASKISKQIAFELTQAAPQRLCYWTTPHAVKLLYVCLQASKQANNSNNIEKMQQQAKKNQK